MKPAEIASTARASTSHISSSLAYRQRQASFCPANFLLAQTGQPNTGARLVIDRERFLMKALNPDPIGRVVNGAPQFLEDNDQCIRQCSIVLDQQKRACVTYWGTRLFESNEYHALITDGILPGLDGLEVVRRIRSSYRSNAPVLMLSARTDLEDKINALDAGADDYLR